MTTNQRNPAPQETRLAKMAAVATVLGLPIAIAGLYFAYRQPQPAKPTTTGVEMSPSQTQANLAEEREAKIRRARLGIRAIATAVETYYFMHGVYPDSLAQLVEKGSDGGAPLLQSDDLLDPWGQRYLYANPGARNATKGVPDVWSSGPDLLDESGIIGNW